MYEQTYEMRVISYEILDFQISQAVTEAGGNRHIDSG